MTTDLPRDRVLDLVNDLWRDGLDALIAEIERAAAVLAGALRIREDEPELLCVDRVSRAHGGRVIDDSAVRTARSRGLYRGRGSRDRVRDRGRDRVR